MCQNNSYHEMTFKFCNKFNISECYTTNNISSSRMTNNRTVLASLLYIPENHFYQLNVILRFGNFSLISGNITLSECSSVIMISCYNWFYLRYIWSSGDHRQRKQQRKTLFWNNICWRKCSYWMSNRYLLWLSITSVKF